MPSKTGAYALFVQHGISQINAGGAPQTKAPAAPTAAQPLPLLMLSAAYSTYGLSLALSASAAYSNQIIIYATRPLLAGFNKYAKGAFKVIGSLPSLSAGINNLSPLYLAKYRVPGAGYQIAVKIVGVNSAGFRTNEVLVTSLIASQTGAGESEDPETAPPPSADDTVLKVA